jgi:uncharacterized protein (TIGR03435 family)
MIELVLLACMACGVSALSQQAPGYAYEAVVIRPNVSGSGSTRVNVNPGLLVETNVDLTDVIRMAYGLQSADQLAGLPGWAGSARYDITAKADVETAARMKALNHDAFVAAGQQALQALLLERFGLRVHHETRELAEYALVQTKGGSKLVAGDEMGKDKGNVRIYNHKLTATAVRLEELTGFLSRQVHRPVIDRTGLAGKFDVTLVWSPDDASASQADPAADKAPGLFTAIEEQLGLRLESIKGSVDTVVVDQIQQPTEN